MIPQPPAPGPRAAGSSRHLITPEYPPQSGGVSDYVRLLAEGLQDANEEVHVWCPPASGSLQGAGAVHVHRDLGQFRSADLRRVDQQLDRFPAPRRLLVQWVPHGFGYRSMNLPFCFWLRNRARRHGDQVEIMVHEAFLAFEGSWRQYAAASVHRLMTVVLLQAAERIWVSIPRCGELWRPYALGRTIPSQWLPLPSNIPVASDAQAIAAIRARYLDGGGLLIGHFGTFGKAVGGLLEEILLKILQCDEDARVVLIGPGGDFRNDLLRKYPGLAGKVFATGNLAASDPALSHHIGACDLMIQPYPDGVSSRRTSLMASLNHGKPVVTTSGPATESIWLGSDAVAMTPIGNAEAFVAEVHRLCTDAGRRAALGRAAQRLYAERFDIRHAVAALHPAPEGVACAS